MVDLADRVRSYITERKQFHETSHELDECREELNRAIGVSFESEFLPRIQELLPNEYRFKRQRVNLDYRKKPEGLGAIMGIKVVYLGKTKGPFSKDHSTGYDGLNQLLQPLFGEIQEKYGLGNCELELDTHY